MSFAGGMLTLLSGCASEAPLRPPSAMLPAAVRSLAAARSGNAVSLTWTTPRRTTDDVLLEGRHGAGRLTAEICRDTEPSPRSACTPVANVAVTAGTSGSYTDTLPADLADGTPRAIRYRVKVHNGRGVAGMSADTQALAGSAPLPIRNLRAQRTVQGVQLRWQPSSTGDEVLIRVTRGEGTAAKTTLLRIPAAAADSGGGIDGGAKPGIASRYVVSRAHSADVAGTTLSAEGESATVEVAAGAPVAPPSAPSGLEAVVNTLGAAEIDLVWTPLPDPGVVGYLVFRTSGDEPPSQITPQPVAAFSFADTSVQPGHSYRYSVAAVAAGGMVGGRSRETTAAIPPQ